MIPSISCALTSSFFAFNGNKSEEDEDDAFSMDSVETFSDDKDKEPCGIPLV